MSDAGATHIVLTGATGRTGNAVAHALVARDDVRLAAVVAPSVASGTPSRPLPTDVPAFATLAAALDELDGSFVLVDLTHADAAVEHLELALERRVPTVLGTTGFAAGVIEDWGARFAAAEVGLFVVPNFSVGAVLAMGMAAQLAEHFPDVEIIEAHHDGKRDSPSGTARHTAALVDRARRASGLQPGPGAASAGTDPSRGELIEGVPVHALRIPGATAHQEVVFGAPGEIVTIRHDAIDRSCYAHGVAIAASHARGLRGLETGLEHVL